jgi:hypothetical protein
MVWLAVIMVVVLIIGGALRTPVLRWWYWQQAGFYAARMTFVAGFGTSWLLSVVNRIVTQLISAKAARDISRGCWVSVAHGEMRGHEIHLLVLSLLRELLQKTSFPDAAVEKFMTSVDRESIRREERRLYCWAEADVTVRILQELANDTRDGLHEPAPAQGG